MENFEKNLKSKQKLIKWPCYIVVHTVMSKMAYFVFFWDANSQSR